ncbi:hypothetical protein GCM10011613_14170 [Cellvibrio zantedeschiae]|uniref:DUF3999 domain-containing protein n=1 Tax=Cellvibrio zantedeschiae TaxID=1237077 RepID=A0ABQ3AXV0_9GAMM|nr:DUF3999 family protein [Cellvibrio zantedeschiae]GGY70825.1 hypothetical protein GCM10011613_14170 [Cellvibrio zantedeschiae]
MNSLANSFVMHNVKRYFSIIVLLGATLFSMNSYCATPIYQVNDVEGTFIQVPLSHEIYQYSREAGLQDLVVLDAEQNPLPYRLVSIANDTRVTEEKVVSESLRFFPVAPDATPDTLRKLHTSQISVRGNNTQVATTDKTLNNATPEFYLVDISQLDHELTSLTVDWVGQINNQYLEVELEGTRNLKNWYSLARSTLVQITQQDETLKRNYIDVKIPKKDFEFLRLKILRGAENLQITQVVGEQKIGEVIQKTNKETWSLKGTTAKTQTTVYLPGSHSKTYPVAAWEFNRNEVTPIDTLAIDFGTYTYGDSAKIFSRNNEKQNWQLRHQGIWFNAQVGSQWQKSSPVSVYANRDKYWRIELNDSAKNIAAPNLIFGWQPTQLQIITNNKPPYVLAIEEGTHTNNREQVFNQIIGASKPVWVGASLHPLEVSPDAFSRSKSVIDWKQWLFWVALVLAVGVLLAFSLKLFKQLNVSKVD